jgi:superfamily II DNA/RNA helicase
LAILATGVDILVGTPGRMQDFIDRGNVSLSYVQFLILDEADRMLDMGFEPQVRKIVQRSNMPGPGQRQTLMFSATFPPPMQKLAGEFMQDYIWVGVGRVGSTVASIEQRLVLATNNKREKFDLLINVLYKHAQTKADGQCPRTLVFVKKKSSARWVWQDRTKFVAFVEREQTRIARLVYGFA